MIKKLYLVLFILGLTFGPQSSHAATITFADMQAVISIADNPLPANNRILSLMVDSTLFGPGGFAEGNATITNGVFQDYGQVQWQAVVPVGSPTTLPPDDGTPAINFFIDPAGEISGVDPEPFRLLAGITNGVFTPLWELDFSNVTGSLGSLNLAGLVAHGVDANGVRTGVEFQVDPFTIQAVPIPAAIWLFGTALVVLVGIGKRKKAT